MALFSFFSIDANEVSWLFFSLVAGFAGLCMGMVGVGGVVIVPAGIAFLQAEPKMAIASTMPGYLATALVGSWSYKTKILQNQRRCMMLVLGAAIGSLSAAFFLAYIPEKPLAVGVSIFAISFGIKAIVDAHKKGQAKPVSTAAAVKSDDGDGDIEANGYAVAPIADNNSKLQPEPESNVVNTEVDVIVNTEVAVIVKEGNDDDDSNVEDTDGKLQSEPDSNAIANTEATEVAEYDMKQDVTDVFIGILVGIGSGLTGTSGPLFTIPLIMLQYPDTDPKTTVGFAMIVGLPISILMTVGNAIQEQPMDMGLSLVVAAATSLCVPLGKNASVYLEVKLGGKLGDQVVLCTIGVVFIITGLYVFIKQVL